MDSDSLEDEFDPWTVPLPSLAVRRAQHAHIVAAEEDPEAEDEEPDEISLEAQKLIDLARKAWRNKNVKVVLKAPPVRGSKRTLLPPSKKKHTLFSLDQCLVVSIEGEISKLDAWNDDEDFPPSPASVDSNNHYMDNGCISPSNQNHQRSLNAGKMDKLLEENVMLSSSVQQLRDELEHQREIVASLKRELSVVVSTTSTTTNGTTTSTTTHTHSASTQLQALRKDSEDLAALRKAHALLRKEADEVKGKLTSQTEELERLRIEHPVLRSTIVAATANLKRSTERVQEQQVRISAAEEESRSLKTQIVEVKQRFGVLESELHALRAELDQARTSRALDQEVIGELHGRATTMKRSTKKFEDWVTAIRAGRVPGFPVGSLGVNSQVLNSLERIALWLQDLVPLPSPLPSPLSPHGALPSLDFERDDEEDEDEGFTLFTATLAENLWKDRPHVETAERRESHQGGNSGSVSNGSELKPVGGGRSREEKISGKHFTKNSPDSENSGERKFQSPHQRAQINVETIVLPPDHQSEPSSSDDGVEETLRRRFKGTTRPGTVHPKQNIQLPSADFSLIALLFLAGLLLGLIRSGIL